MQGKRILENLKQQQHTFAAGLLQTRLLECEAAGQLGNGLLMSMSLSDMRGYIQLTKSLWNEFPVKIQIQISCRYILEEFNQMVTALKQQDEETAVDRLKRGLSIFDLSGSQWHWDSSFNAENPLLGNVLLSLLKEVVETNTAAENEMDIDRIINEKDQQLDGMKHAAQASNQIIT